MTEWKTDMASGNVHGNFAQRRGAPGPLAGLVLLVVDDAPDFRFIISAFLKRKGAEVVAVESARDALLLLETRAIDLIISDICMPEQDGWAFLRELRSIGPLRARELPAIALSTLSDQTERRESLAAGFQCHTTKPVDIELLTATILRLLACEEQATPADLLQASSL